MADFGWSYPPGCNSVPADDDPTCDCDQHPETHIHCPTCKRVIPPTTETCEYCELAKLIDPMEDGYYLGDEQDGVYVGWSIGETHVLFLSVVDCGTAHFVDDFGGEEYVTISEARLRARIRLEQAADWCDINGVTFDENDLDRFLREADDTFNSLNPDPA